MLKKSVIKTCWDHQGSCRLPFRKDCVSLVRCVSVWRGFSSFFHFFELRRSHGWGTIFAGCATCFELANYDAKGPLRVLIMNWTFSSNDQFSVFVCEGGQVEYGLHDYMDWPTINEHMKSCISSGNLICFHHCWSFCGTKLVICKNGNESPVLPVMIWRIMEVSWNWGTPKLMVYNGKYGKFR